MNSLPLAFAALLIVVGSAAVSAVVLNVVRPRLPAARSEHHNDIVGFFFGAVALLYTVIVAFLVFAVWQRFSESSQAVTTEASALVVAFRDTQSLPEPGRSEAQAALRSYVGTVIENEWRTHGAVLPHRTRDVLNPVWNVYRSAPLGEGDDGQRAEARDHLAELETTRHLRHLAGEASLPNVSWVLLVGGAVVTVGTAFLFRLENARVHTLLVAVLGGSIAGALFLILTLNHPFTGKVHVSRAPFTHALRQFEALNIQAPVPPDSTPPTTAPAPAKVVEVAGTEQWTDTGIDVTSGERIAVRSTGSVHHSSSDETGPDGDDSADLRQFNVLPEGNHSGLIAKVGDAGRPFIVGSDFAGAVPAGGRLFLGINDAGLGNNSGAFRASVTVLGS